MGIIGAIGDFLGNVSLDDVGNVLDVGSKIAGVYGQAKGGTQSTPSQVTGYAGLPPQVQQYLMESVLPQIQAQATAPRVSVPYRRADASDYDPVFGSKARVALQDYYDRKAVGDAAKAEEKAKAEAEAQKVQAAQGSSNMDATAYINSLGSMNGRGTTGNAFFDQMGMQDRINSIIAMDGKVNKYNGEKVNASELLSSLPQVIAGGRGLMGQQQANGQLMTDQQKKARDVYFRNATAAEYDPSMSLIDSILPILASTLITGGAGAAMAAGGVPALVAKGVSTAAGQLR